MGQFQVDVGLDADADAVNEETGRLQEELRRLGGPAPGVGVAFSLDGRQLATASDDKTAGAEGP